jgi:hypothetical protein
VRLIDSIDSEKNQIGDTFHASLNAPLSAEGSEAFPVGTDVAGHVVDLKSASKFAGQSLVVLQLDSITSNGKNYSLQTDQYRKEGSSRGKNTAEKVGGGAILGGIIGAIAGGGRGAAIGTAAGAGVGAGAQVNKSSCPRKPCLTSLCRLPSRSSSRLIATPRDQSWALRSKKLSDLDSFRRKALPAAKRFCGALLKAETVSGYPNIHRYFFVFE